MRLIETSSLPTRKCIRKSCVVVCLFVCLFVYFSPSLPILATQQIQQQLGGTDPFLDLLATETGLAPESILDFDISLADTQAGSIGGLHREFVFAGRLDNQVACFTGIKVSVE